MYITKNILTMLPCRNFLDLICVSVALPRSKSTPGLVESSGKTTLETMPMSRHYTLPAGLISDPNAVRKGSHSEMRSLTPEDDDGCSNSEQNGGSHHSGSGNVHTDTSASMTIKLNQQQWEVEHRLAEIEMQICGSDSAGSCSDEKSIGNKESVI